MSERFFCFLGIIEFGSVPSGRFMGSQLQDWRFRSVGTFGVYVLILFYVTSFPWFVSSWFVSPQTITKTPNKPFG